jgi:hypothetical protein
LLAWLDKIFSIVGLIIPTTLDFYAGISKAILFCQSGTTLMIAQTTTPNTSNTRINSPNIMVVHLLSVLASSVYDPQPRFRKFFLSKLQYLRAAQTADDHTLVFHSGVLEAPICLGDYLRRALLL